ncbi:hypothetical protein CEXT_662501 [Caerostris extrusa]|uniref:Uncharacterized protein n=1 Tax=Caerostris extrusa TaxID=172846 RepID=A0AAV4VDY5_CAEEX|nr:hypothetical protein CEXT_662501 [Caerostris extrusa]
MKCLLPQPVMSPPPFSYHIIATSQGIVKYSAENEPRCCCNLCSGVAKTGGNGAQSAFFYGDISAIYTEQYMDTMRNHSDSLMPSEMSTDLEDSANKVMWQKEV